MSAPIMPVMLSRRALLPLVFHHNPLRFLTGMHQHYGDRVFIRLGDRCLALLNHPDDIREVLVVHPQAFTKAHLPGGNHLGDLLGNGLLTSEDPYHHQQRVLLQPAFHREQLATYAAAMVQAAEEEAADWHDGMTIDMATHMQRLTLRIVGETLFGTRINTTAATVYSALGTAMGAMRRLGRSPFFAFTRSLPWPTRHATATDRAFMQAKETLDRIIADLIAAHRQSAPGQGDILTVLLESRDATGQGLTETQIRDEALTLFLAGHETTANALTWTWWLLSQHPDVMARLHAELWAELRGHAPQMIDLAHLPYTHMVIQESMRLYPPAWAIARQATQTMTWQDVTLQAGDVVVMSQYVVHHDARWYANPEAFQPERWVIPPTNAPKFAYFPFGGGPRLCIGERFACMEAELVLATLAQRWSPHVVPGHPVVPQPLVTLRPRYGLQMMLASASGAS